MKRKIGIRTYPGKHDGEIPCIYEKSAPAGEAQAIQIYAEDVANLAEATNDEQVRGKLQRDIRRKLPKKQQEILDAWLEDDGCEFREVREDARTLIEEHPESEVRGPEMIVGVDYEGAFF